MLLENPLLFNAVLCNEPAYKFILLGDKSFSCYIKTPPMLLCSNIEEVQFTQNISQLRKNYGLEIRLY